MRTFPNFYVLGTLVSFVLGMMPLSPAQSQLSGLPGLPFAAPQQCQQLRALRDEWVKHARAVQAVDRKQASPGEQCNLHRDFVAAESAMVKGLERHGGVCSVPTDVIERTWLQHINTIRVANRICTTGARWPRPPLTGDFWTPDEWGRIFGP